MQIQVFEVASVRLMEREPKLISLEKAINPLLDDNDIIGFSFILNEIIQECKNLPKSVAFHTKVDAKKVPAAIISFPIRNKYISTCQYICFQGTVRGSFSGSSERSL